MSFAPKAMFRCAEVGMEWPETNQFKCFLSKKREGKKEADRVICNLSLTH